MRLGIAIAALMMIVAPHQVGAQERAPMSANDILEMHKQSDDVLLFLESAGEALGWASAYIEERGEQPLYCQPLRLSISPEQYREILSTYVEAHPEQGKRHAIQVLLTALRYAFPC